MALANAQQARRRPKSRIINPPQGHVVTKTKPNFQLFSCTGGYCRGGALSGRGCGTITLLAQILNCLFVDADAIQIVTS